MTFNDDLMELITNGQNTLMEKLNTVQNIMELYKRDVEEIKFKVNDIIDEKSNLKNEVKTLKRELNYVTNKSREQNIILYNIKDDPDFNENIPENIKKLFQEIKVELEKSAFKDAKRIGVKEGKRPVLVTLESTNLKKALFDKADEL